MGIIIYFTLLLLAVFRPKSKYVFFLFLVFSWILYAFNTYSGDYLSYLNRYDNHIYGGMEPGFRMVMILCSRLGLSFTGFRTVLATIYVCVLGKGVKKYTQYSAFAMALLALFPLTYFVSVLRSGVAMCFVFYGIGFLQEKGWKGAWKYLLFVVLAVCFHRSSVVFLLLFLSRKRIGYAKLGGIMLGLTAFTFVLFKTSWIAQLLSSISENPRILSWFNNNSISHPNRNGIIAILIIVSSMMIIEKYSKRIAEAKFVADGLGHGERVYPFYLLVDNIFLLSLLFLPFAVFADTFMRFYYILFPLLICACTESFSYPSVSLSTKLRVPLISLFLIVLTVLMFIYTDLPYLGTENDGLYVFYNNAILGLKLFGV